MVGNRTFYDHKAAQAAADRKARQLASVAEAEQKQVHQPPQGGEQARAASEVAGEGGAVDHFDAVEEGAGDRSSEGDDLGGMDPQMHDHYDEFSRPPSPAVSAANDSEQSEADDLDFIDQHQAFEESDVAESDGSPSPSPSRPPSPGFDDVFPPFFAPATAPRSDPILAASNSSAGTGETPSSKETGESNIVQSLFQLIVTYLAVFCDLSTANADLLLRFFAVCVVPLLNIPSSPLQARTAMRQLGLDAEVVTYAVCPTCARLREYSIVLPLKAREQCGRPGCGGIIAGLLKGATVQPVKKYGYAPLQPWLELLLGEDGMEERLSEWRDRPRTAGVYSDIYDGSAWTEHVDQYGQPYDRKLLSLKIAFGWDGFSPFHGRSPSFHSSGALLVQLLDLPQDLRRNQRYLHLGSVTPGPVEPNAEEMVEYLQPFIADLKKLDTGVVIKTRNRPLGTLVRVVPHVFVGDVPARIKICGLPGQGCHGQFCPWCTVVKPDLASTLEQPAPARDPATHRTASLKAGHDFGAYGQKGKRVAFQREQGAAYTPLHELRSWRSIERSVVDILHALFLGVDKRFWLQTLIEGGLVSTAADFRLVSSIISAALVPSELQKPNANLGLPAGGNPTALEWATHFRVIMPFLFLSLFHERISPDDAASRQLAFSWDSRTASSRGRATKANKKGDGGTKGKGKSEEPAVDLEGASGGDGPGDEVDGPVLMGKVGEKRVLRLQIDARELHENLSHLVAMNDLASRRKLTESDLDLLDLSNRKYHQGQRSLIGPGWLTYNSHTLQHLTEHIRRFGPPHEFDTFTFETGNKVVGSAKTNGHKDGSIELSFLLRAGQRERLASALKHAPELPGFLPEHLALIQRMQTSAQERARKAFDTSRVEGVGNDSLKTGHLKPVQLDGNEYITLVNTLQYYYPDDNIIPSTSFVAGSATNTVPHTAHSLASLEYLDHLFTPLHGRSNAAAGNSFAAIQIPRDTILRPARVLEALVVETSNRCHVLLRVSLLVHSPLLSTLVSSEWCARTRCTILSADSSEGERWVPLASLRASAALVPFTIDQQLLWGFKMLDDL